MWNCPKCSSPVDDTLEICGACGTSTAGRLDPNFQKPLAAAAVESPVGASLEPGSAATEPAVATAEPQAEAPAATLEPAREPTAWEVLRALESELSALMDAKATPDWQVNPAFHPDVNAFIEGHANNSGFVQKARGLQQNRAKFYAKVKGMDQARPAPAVEPIAAAEPVPETEALAEAVAVAIPMEEGAEVETAVPMAEPLSLAASPQPSLQGARWFRRLAKLTFALLFGAIVVVLVASIGYRQYGKKQLENAIAETNQLDPNWQWASLLVNRADVPDDRNAALLVLKVAKQLTDAPSLVDLDLSGLAPRESISEENLFLLQQERERAQPALGEGKELTELVTGRYSDSQAGLEEMRAVDELYQHEALLHAEENRADLALADCRRLMNTASSIGDDPAAMRQMQRLTAMIRACRVLERVLARTNTASETALAQVQERILDEINQPILRTLLRGERAQDFELYASPDAFDPADGESSPWQLLWQVSPALGRFLLAGDHLSRRAELLKLTNNWVQLAQAPVEQLSQAASQHSDGEPLASVFRFEIDAYLRYQTSLRCAATALACERYQLVHRAWPETLDELVPQYLPATPVDPYDGQPLRLQRTEDGVVVRSVGFDLADEQRALALAKLGFGEGDIVFRLFDTGKRRP